jgi:hypothetical protein
MSLLKRLSPKGNADALKKDLPKKHETVLSVRSSSMQQELQQEIHQSKPALNHLVRA